MTNLIIVKKLEILREFPNCDPETQSEQMLSEKRHQETRSAQGCWGTVAAERVADRAMGRFEAGPGSGSRSGDSGGREGSGIER